MPLLWPSSNCCIYIFRSLEDDEEDEKTKKDKNSKSKQNQVTKKQLKALAMKESKQQGNKKHNFDHPLLVTSLKEHSQNILNFDFSINGKYLASCSEGKSKAGF